MTIKATESDALMSTRRWLMIVGTVVWISATLIIARYQWTFLSATEHVLVLIGVCLFVVAIATSGNTQLLWLFPLGQSFFLLCAFVAPETSPTWLALTTLSSWLGYFLIALTSQKIGLLCIPVAATVTLIAWRTHPNVVVPGALEIFGGWVVFGQLIGGSAALWWAWNTLKDEARTGDQLTEDLELETSRSFELQERARAWRVAATYVHESVLNTVRYALVTTSIDGSRLNEEIALASSGRRSRVWDHGSSTADLIQEVAFANFEHLSVSVVGSVPDVELEREVFESLRAAIVELMRNIDRHSVDKRVELSMEVTPEASVIICLEGGAPVDEKSVPGIGRTTVVEQSLDSIGARFATQRISDGRAKSFIEIHLANHDSTSPHSQAVGFPPFDKARLLVTSPLAAMSVVGSIYFIHLMFLDQGITEISAWLGLAGIAIAAAIVVRRYRLKSWLGALLVLLPALVPTFLVRTEFACSDSGFISPVLTISGFTVMIISAWSGRLAGSVGLAVWAIGGWNVVMSFSANCRDSVALALLNSLVVLPIILIVSFVGAKAYRKAADRSRALRLLEIAERSRAQAAQEVNAQLDDAISSALEVLEMIANGSELTDELRNELEVQDGRIRAAIQVDSERDGSFAVLMRSLVEEVADLGIRTRVKAMVSSHDSRPIDADLHSLLYALLVANRTQRTQVQVFTDGVEDHLVLTVERNSLREVGLSPRERQEFGDVALQVEEGEDREVGESAYAVILSRAIEVWP